MAINITGNPGVPSLGDPENFNSDALTFFDWLMKETAGGFIYQLENIDPGDYFSVQSSPTDTTAGRLMRADYGFSPGNLLGTVTQSGGTPTGAVIERGSNTNGAYVRFADGTQICTHTLSIPSAQDGTGVTGIWRSDGDTWTFPAAFSEPPTVTGTGRDNLSWVMVANTGVTTVDSGPLRVASFVERTSSFNITVAAIGRWF
jgi:hypothetical protein